MAGKPKPMSQIKQLIRLYQAGTGKKTIARDLGLSKNTVKAYISKLQGLKVDLGELLSLDDPVLETRFHAGNPAYKDTRFEQLRPLLGDFLKELGKTGVTRHLLWGHAMMEAFFSHFFQFPLLRIIRSRVNAILLKSSLNAMI